MTTELYVNEGQDRQRVRLTNTGDAAVEVAHGSAGDASEVQPGTAYALQPEWAAEWVLEPGEALRVAASDGLAGAKVTVEPVDPRGPGG